MRFPYFLATLAAAVVGSIMLGILAEFSIAKTVFFAVVILVVSQLVYIAQIMIMAAIAHKTTTPPKAKETTVASSELKIPH